MFMTAFIRFVRAVRWVVPEEARVPAGDRATYSSAEGLS